MFLRRYQGSCFHSAAPFNSARICLNRTIIPCVPAKYRSAVWDNQNLLAKSVPSSVLSMIDGDVLTLSNFVLGALGARGMFILKGKVPFIT